MTPDITQEAIQALTTKQLEQLDGWIRDECRARADKHKQETLAKIRALASSIEVGVKIEGVKGRPAKAGSHRKKIGSYVAQYRTSSLTPGLPDSKI